MVDERQRDVQMDGFVLGRPALVCRWRLAHRELPLENRHLRALGRRMANGAQVSRQLVAWAKQHIEWTLADGSAQYPDGVLMIIVDERGQAAMTVGPFEPLAVVTTSSLAERAAHASVEAGETGVAPETLWAFRGEELVYDDGGSESASGAASLMLDLASTVGFTVVRESGLSRAILDGTADVDEVMLVSDEFGIVSASDACGPRSKRFVDGYAKLLERRRR